MSNKVEEKEKQEEQEKKFQEKLSISPKSVYYFT